MLAAVRYVFWVVLVLVTSDHTARGSGTRDLLSSLRSHMSLSPAKRDWPDLSQPDLPAPTGGAFSGKCDSAAVNFDWNNNGPPSCNRATWTCVLHRCSLLIIPCASRDATTLNFKIPRNECVHIERAQFLPGQPIRTEMEGHIGDPNPTDLLDHVRRAYSGDGNLKAHTEIDKCFVPSLFVEGRRITCPQGK